jgi:hypothetical protein
VKEVEDVREARGSCPNKEARPVLAPDGGVNVALISETMLLNFEVASEESVATTLMVLVTYTDEYVTTDWLPRIVH